MTHKEIYDELTFTLEDLLLEVTILKCYIFCRQSGCRFLPNGADELALLSRMTDFIMQHAEDAAFLWDRY